MKPTRWIAAALLIALVGLPGTALAQAKKQIVIGSTSSASSVFVYFVALAKAINQYAPGLNATVVETGATLDNLRRMERGQIDLGLVTGETAALKFAGQGPFKGAADNTLRTLIVFDNLPVVFLVRADAGIHDLHDLNGKAYNFGINGSSTEMVSNMMFDVLGIKIVPFKGTTGDAVNAMKDGRIVGYAKAGIRDASILDVMSTTKVSVVGLSPEEDKLVESKLPKGLLWLTVPKGSFEGVDAVRTWGLAPGIVTKSSFPADEAYAILKAHDEGFKTMAAAYPNIADQDLWTRTIQGAGVPLHAGTVRFLREKGVAIPPELIPPEAK